ncbi:ead/Ea22-like family protein [Klebsiella pneumoniae]|uniref:ead/Ea22-like family protein n=1 Tax=Klebsiella pneumoniae TaxID=573 RepID=UPI0011552538|nr:ead/Ea22-like family protein [Klebsiella pneumoniae]
MTDITELAQRMKTAAEKATQGEWWADEVKNEGCYGSGDDCVEGFTSYAIYGSDGQTLFDSLNSDAACISEEYDGEGHVAWDETAQRNAEFITLANPANVLALVEELEKSEKTSEARREAIDRTHNMFVRERDRANEAEEALEKAQQRITELESRTVKLPKLKMLEDYLAEVAIEERKQILVGVKLEFHRACVAAGIKVEDE